MGGSWSAPLWGAAEGDAGGAPSRGFRAAHSTLASRDSPTRNPVGDLPRRRGYAVAHAVDGAGPVAVRDDARVRHAMAEGVLTLLDVAGVDAGGDDADADLARSWLRIRHLAD